MQLEGGARYLVSAAGLAETGAMRAGVVLTLAQVARLAHEDAVTAEVNTVVRTVDDADVQPSMGGEFSEPVVALVFRGDG